MKCGVCEKEHEPGSADWRDCQADLFDRLVDNPEEWKFTLTPEQQKRVNDGYQEYLQIADGGLPDIDGLRVAISRQFVLKDDDQATVTDVKGLTKFWEGFQADMPEVFVRHGGLQARSLSLAWTDKKMRHLMALLKLNYVDWDTSEVAANLKSIQDLRRAADLLESEESSGKSLYHLEVKDSISTWYFRKSKIVVHQLVSQEEKRS